MLEVIITARVDSATTPKVFLVITMILFGMGKAASLKATNVAITMVGSTNSYQNLHMEISH
jgi:hypothetical protein